MIKKPSFLERLTGSTKVDSSEEDFDQENDFDFGEDEEESSAQAMGDEWIEEGEEEQDGELPVDMYQTQDSIVIRALVAGVSPEDLNISITRDMVTLQGQREEVQEVYSTS